MTDREIDALIAEKFIGGCEWSEQDGKRFLLTPSGYTLAVDYGNGDIQGKLLNYSTDPTACALILDEIERRGWGWDWEYPWQAERGDYQFRIRGKDYVLVSDANRYRAVCLAALRALGVEV